MSLKKKYKKLQEENESLELTCNQLQAKNQLLVDKCHKQVLISRMKNELNEEKK